MTFTIGAVPWNPNTTKVDETLDHLIFEIQQFGRKLDLLVFPECSLTGFYPEHSHELAKSETKRFENFFSYLAKSLGTFVLAGAFRETAEGPGNQAVFFSPSGIEISKYQKINLFTLANENQFVSPGEESTSQTISTFEVSPKICYDLRFPSEFITQAPRIDLFAVIANWPDKRAEHWLALLKARAIENEAFVLGLNRSGKDLTGNTYSVQPIIFDPVGEKCIPIYESKLVSIWSLSDRLKFETVGSTLGKNSN